jgi:hypothetical protein
MVSVMESTLKKDIKFNCDVSDAQYWGYFSICGLLLRYRDLYRSEQGLKPWTDISRADIAAWIEAKEARWPELEQMEFLDLTIGEKSYHAFDVEGVNRALEPQGLVYGAGYGMYMKPTFFLAELRSSREITGLTVRTSSLELVRDLFTAPAMLQGDSVFLRLEPLRVLLHFKFSELNTRRNSALEDAFNRYGFRHRQLMDETFERRLEELAEQYAEIILHHEIAEQRESVPDWKEILTAAGDRKNEHYLRALKDLIADTSEAGPLKRIIETRDRAALGLSLALTEGFHRVLFPGLGAAYAEFINNGDWGVIERTRKEGHCRFLSERERVVQLYRSSTGNEDFSSRLKKTI